MIKPQTIEYYTAASRELNAAREWVPTFNGPTMVGGCSVQSIPRKSYADMGLDFNSFYLRVVAPLSIIDLQRDQSGDRFVWQGDWYQMKDGTNWYALDGWARAIAVRVKQGGTGL